MQKMTRHEKKKYYNSLIDNVVRKYYDFPNRNKYEGNSRTYGKLHEILYFDMDDTKRERVIHKDSKLSALRNGFIRTIKKIDEMNMDYHRKQKVFYDLVDIYYAIHVDLLTQIDMAMRETQRRFDPNTNEGAYIYWTQQKTKKIKPRK